MANPFDPDAALAAIRPRLAAARRRRRSIAASSLIAFVAFGSVAGATVLPGREGPRTVVATSTDEDVAAETTVAPEETTTTSSTVEVATTTTATLPETTTTAAPAPPPPPPPPPPAPPTTVKPPAPPTTVKPTTTTVVRTPVNHTFTYPDTGTLTVSFDGVKLRFVGAAAADGWTWEIVWDSQDKVGVVFRNANVERYLKARISSEGEVYPTLWEEVKCMAPAGTSTFEAPNGAGTVTVTIDGGTGQLSITEIVANSGWTSEIRSQSYDSVKVKFWNDAEGNYVWIQISVKNCQLEVAYG